MTPSDFTELVNTVGSFGAMLFVLCGVILTVLYYIKTKIDGWGEPWIKGQIELTKSLTLSSESQARSLEALVRSFQVFEESTKVLASGMAQILDAGDGRSQIKLEGLEFKFRKMSEEKDNMEAELNVMKDREKEAKP